MAIRITGGDLGGRFIQSPEGRQTRPTSAISRQALGNILVDEIPGARVLDLFAGSGVVSAELLSRGAEAATLVEKARPTVQLLQRNMASLGLTASAKIMNADVLKLLESGFPEGVGFHIIYADPPFVDAYPDLRPAVRWLIPGGVAVFEMPSRSLPEWASEASDLRKYGESTLAFFRAKA